LWAFKWAKIVGITGFRGLWALEWAWQIRVTNLFVGVAYSRNKLALRKRLRNLDLKSQFSIYIRVTNLRCV